MPGPDWRERMGELYGVPVRTHDGWGVAVYPTQ